jgi:uncharacterized phage-like protein YoqJ
MLEESKTEEYKQRKKEEKDKEELERQLIRQTVCFTGHRPNKLFGYDLNDKRYKPLYEQLTNVVELCINEEDIIRFISGAALGVDQISFWLVHKLKIKYPDIKNIVAVPFKNQDKVWSIEQKHWYKKMLEKADEVIYIDELNDYRYKVNNNIVGEYSIEKMQRRNEWMVDNSRIVIAVHDDSKGGTKNCIYYAHKEGKSIFKINPKYNFELDIRYGRYHKD